jgi:hypothetical protein
MRNPTIAFLAGYSSTTSFVSHDRHLTSSACHPLLAPFFSNSRPPRRRIQCHPLFSTNGDGEEEEEDEQAFLMKQLARIQAMDEELDQFVHDDVDDSFDDDFLDLFDGPDEQDLAELEKDLSYQVSETSQSALEEALKQGVVPADAGVGSGSLSGDFGFDPLNLSRKDYIGVSQRFVQSLVPGPAMPEYSMRPFALILRDYREAEIRHGRLAMLASILWPVQEMLDRFVLEENQFGSLVYGAVTLPFIPLFMTLVMMLLGYLDIYCQVIKDEEQIGEAFLPGDCFWDPLAMLQGAPDTMKRNMQERELFNGRMAMLAVAVYFWEELVTRKPLIEVRGNELLFEPAYEEPFIQSWLDAQFQGSPSVFVIPDEVISQFSNVQ